MSKKIGHFLLAFLVAVIGSGALACGRIDNAAINPKADPSKTQLYVLNYNGGFGSEWLFKARTRFEEFYRETSFETGKEGVQVMVTPTKDLLGTVRQTWSVRTDDIIFHEGFNDYSGWIRDGLLMDISDVVTEALTEHGENQSIEKKLTEKQKTYLKATDGKYYAVPHYAAFGGLVYDRDMFDREFLYFKKDWQSSVTDVNDKFQWADAFVTDLAQDRSAGPDGDHGTPHDNGLPATYEEFFLLCNYIADIGFRPLTWMGGGYEQYFQFLMTALEADYEGMSEYDTVYSLNGTANTLVDSIAAGSPVGTVTFAAPLTLDSGNALTDGKEMYRRAGLYYSLKFVETVIKNPAWYDPARQFSTTHSHIDAQSDFLYSSLEPAQKDIAMLVESNWWESEISPVMTQMTERYGDRASKYKRNLRYMPLPRPTQADVGKKTTMVDALSAYGAVRAGLPAWRADLAKKFMRFVNTDVSLKEFTVTTNTTKALGYALSETDLSSMSHYGRSVYESQMRSDISYPYSDNPIFLYNADSLTSWSTYVSYINNQSYKPVTALYVNKFSAENIFAGYYENGKRIFASLMTE
ncbi:MAG: hypothetical protein LBH24_03950 [Clostridiales bacterium]|jgi:maltose-binding protein MalE|nr:hypothetical protein [Clostridiales bacterium]